MLLYHTVVKATTIAIKKSNLFLLQLLFSYLLSV